MCVHVCPSVRPLSVHRVFVLFDRLPSALAKQEAEKEKAAAAASATEVLRQLDTERARAAEAERRCWLAESLVKTSADKL
eukprot:SAG11_NODE_10670_length_813_cov_0.866947_1_plen_79_part_10